MSSDSREPSSAGEWRPSTSRPWRRSHTAATAASTSSTGSVENPIITTTTTSMTGNETSIGKVRYRDMYSFLAAIDVEGLRQYLAASTPPPPLRDSATATATAATEATSASSLLCCSSLAKETRQSTSASSPAPTTTRERLRDMREFLHRPSTSTTEARLSSNDIWGVLRLVMNQLTTTNADHVKGRQDFKLVQSLYPIRTWLAVQYFLVDYCVSFPVSDTDRTSQTHFVSVFVDALIALGAECDSVVFWLLVSTIRTTHVSSIVAAAAAVVVNDDAIEEETAAQMRSGIEKLLVSWMEPLCELMPLEQDLLFPNHGDVATLSALAADVERQRQHCLRTTSLLEEAAEGSSSGTSASIRRRQRVAWMMLADLAVRGHRRSGALLVAVSRHPLYVSQFMLQTWSQVMCAMQLTHLHGNRRVSDWRQIHEQLLDMDVKGTQQQQGVDDGGRAARDEDSDAFGMLSGFLADHHVTSAAVPVPPDFLQVDNDTNDDGDDTNGMSNPTGGGGLTEHHMRLLLSVSQIPVDSRTRFLSHKRTLRSWHLYILDRLQAFCIRLIGPAAWGGSDSLSNVLTAGAADDYTSMGDYHLLLVLLKVGFPKSLALQFIEAFVHRRPMLGRQRAQVLQLRDEAQRSRGMKDLLHVFSQTA